jgi:hypothetical protein
MNQKDTVQISLCKLDGDCKSNELCSFDEKEMRHQCVPNQKKMFYEGCLNTKKYNEFDKIESNSKENHGNMKNCIDFVRQQKNNDGFFYNYMIYKNKKNSFVDLKTIKVHLKCNQELLLVMPVQEFFTRTCDDKQQKCILKPNSAFFAFLDSNRKTCGGKLSLEIEYSCENENLQNKFQIEIPSNKNQQIEIPLTCPVNLQDDRFQSKCIAAYFDTRDSNPSISKYLDLLDKNIEPENCVQPVYRVPRIVTDTDVYQQLLKHKSEKQIDDYNEKIEQKEKEYYRMKAEQLKIKFKKETGKELNDEDALELVSANKTEYFAGSSSNCKWKIHEHKNLFGKMIEENDIRKYTTPLDGNIHMIEQAKNKACELNATMFLWFSNSYELSNLRNKMFVITPSQLKTIHQDFKNEDWETWAKVNNVHVGVLTNDTELMKELFNGQIQTLNDEMKQYYNQFLTYFDKTKIHTTEKVKNNDELLTELDSKITTITQNIKKNEFESSINQQMQMILMSLIFVFLIITVVYYIYQKMAI